MRFAIVGCGRIANNKHIDAIRKAGGEIAIVCDIIEDRAEKTALKAGCKYTLDYLEVLDDKTIDVIDICTPSGLHPKMAIQALKEGFHVITEKPMALNTKDAKEMISVAQKSGKKLFVVKQNRFNPPIIKLKEALNHNRFGRIMSGTVTVRWYRDQKYYDQDEWRGTKAMDGTVLHNQASHHIDLLLWFLGEPISVFAYGSIGHNIEVEDTIHAIVKFKDSSIGNIEATTCAFNSGNKNDMEGSITILGRNGAVKVGGFAVNKIEYWDFKEKIKEDEFMEKYSTSPENIYGYGHLEFMKHVIRTLEIGGDYIDGKEGIKSLRLIEAICESIKTGKEVKL